MPDGDQGEANRGHGLYITALVMVLVAGLFVLGRVAARWSKRQFGMDDYTIIAALVGSSLRTVRGGTVLRSRWLTRSTSLGFLDLVDPHHQSGSDRYPTLPVTRVGAGCD